MNTVKMMSVAAGLLIFAAAGASTQAAIWYLRVDQGKNKSWNDLDFWTSNSDGSGTTPSALSAADTYSTNGHVLRTPNTTGASNATQVFDGGTLQIDGGTLGLKSVTAIVADLVSNGGTIVNASSSESTNLELQTTTFQANAATTLSGQTDRNSTYSFGTLSGGGDLTMVTNSGGTGGGHFYLSASDASGYSGTLTLDSGAFDFNSDFISGGALVVAGGATFMLDQNLTFTGLTIDGDVFAPGTYSYSDLGSSYASIFGSSTGGSITVVPEPATLALVALAGMMMLRRRHA